MQLKLDFSKEFYQNKWVCGPFKGYLGTTKCSLTEELALLQSPEQQFENGSVIQSHAVLPEFIIRFASMLLIVLAFMNECIKY